MDGGQDLIGWSASEDRPYCCGRLMGTVQDEHAQRTFECVAEQPLADCRGRLTTTWRTPLAVGASLVSAPSRPDVQGG